MAEERKKPENKEDFTTLIQEVMDGDTVIHEDGV